MKKNVKKPLQILDASDHNWVDRFCPLWSKPYLKLSRVDRPIGTWLLLLPCWWGSCLAVWSNSAERNIQDLWIPIGCILGAILMRGAGCTWNDINDRKFDAQVSRTKLRPIPSGQISIKLAMVWLLIQITIAFLILITFNQFAILLGLFSIIPVTVYPFAKRFTWWPQFFLGIRFNWGVLLSYAAHSNSIELSVILFYVAGIFWTLFYDTIYAFQDTEDDALIGLKSTALLFRNYAKFWLAFFIIVIFLMMQLSFNQIPNSNFVSEIIMRCGVGVFCFHLIWQLWKLNITESNTCLRLFQSNKIAGLIMVFFAIIAIILQ